MGRYTYNSSTVSSAISELNDALKAIADVKTEIQAGVNTISNANGIRALNIDFSDILSFQEKAEEVIEDDIQTIKSKVAVIEDYENAPWYKKLFSSIGMGFSKIVEGVVSGLENITDGAVSIIGFVGGIFNSEFKNSVAEYVAKDHVGDWFDKQYDNGFLQGVEKYSYFGEDSTAANIFKGFGTAVPYIALSATGVGMYTEMAVAGLGGIGSGTEAGINKALTNDPNLKAGDVFNKAFGQGLWQGSKNMAYVYAMHKISQIATKNTAKSRKTVADSKGNKIDGAKLSDSAKTQNKLFKNTNKAFNKTRAGKVLSASDDVLKAGGKNVSKVVQKVPGVKTADKLLKSLTNNKIVKVVGNTATKIAANHSILSYGAASALFTADQIDEDVINSEYRIQREQVSEIKKRDYLPGISEESAPEIPGPVPPPVQDYEDTIIPDNNPDEIIPTPNPEENVTPTSNPGGNVTPTSNPGGNVMPTPTTGESTLPTPSPTSTTTEIYPTSTFHPSPTYQPTLYPDNNGGGYTDEGFTGEGTEGEFDIPTKEEVGGSLTEIIGGNQYTNIPSSASPITTTTTTNTSGKKSVIPIIAGLGSAAAAGIGAKAYIDSKEDNSAEEEFEAEEWNEDEFTDLDYQESMDATSDYLSPNDEYAYQESNDEESDSSYEAVNSSELASVQ